MRKLLLGAATLVTSLGLTAGVASATQSSGNVIRDTGPDSRAKIETRIKNRTDINNKNKLDVSNDTKQNAYSGNANVKGNTFGGDAVSGDATNKNAFNVSAKIDNTAAHAVDGAGVRVLDPVRDGGEISNTGPHSDATIKTDVSNSTKVNNVNDINVRNTTNQNAFSGNATVTNNTHGGDAISGDASNFNSTNVTLHVTN